MEAAIQLRDKSVNKLAIYEVPYNNDGNAQQAWKAYIKKLTELLAADKRGDAVALFMQYVGTPHEQIESMRHARFWQALESIAPALAYDHTAILGENITVPTERAMQVQVPTFIMNGGTSFPFMFDTAQALCKAIPHAQLRTLEGQTHDVASEVLVPVLLDFFTS